MIRDIVPELYSWFEVRVALNGYAQHAIETGDPRTLFLCAMQSCVGIREIGGNNKGPLVELMQDTIGPVGAEAWCMSAVQSALAYVEKKMGVKSPIVSSEHCLTTWNNTPIVQRVKHFPLPGAICIWQHGSSSNGHTGVVCGADPQTNLMSLVEGNTEAGLLNGKVVRDGGGVYVTNRSMAGNGNMHVKGFLKPF